MGTGLEAKRPVRELLTALVGCWQRCGAGKERKQDSGCAVEAEWTELAGAFGMKNEKEEGWANGDTIY